MTNPDADIAERKMQFLFALRSKGVTDMAVLSAMEQIDRAPFVRGYFTDRAYDDMPLPIACGQTISQPSVVALMTQALKVTPRDKVLEVGTGSGYQAAILSQLARRVYTVDRHARLVRACGASYAPPAHRPQLDLFQDSAALVLGEEIRHSILSLTTVEPDNE